MSKSIIQVRRRSVEICLVTCAVLWLHAVIPSSAGENVESVIDSRSAIALIEQCRPMGKTIQQIGPDPEELAKTMISSPGDQWLMNTLQFLSRVAEGNGLSGRAHAEVMIDLVSGVYGRYVSSLAANANDVEDASDEAVRMRSQIERFLIGSKFSEEVASITVVTIDRVYPLALHGKCSTRK